MHKFQIPARLITANETSVTDRIVLRTVAGNTLKLSPNRRISCSFVQVRKLQGTAGAVAGIPLDQSGLQFSDLDGANFTSYKSVTIKFLGQRGERGLAQRFYGVLIIYVFRFDSRRFQERVPDEDRCLDKAALESPVISRQRAKPSLEISIGTPPPSLMPRFALKRATCLPILFTRALP